MKYKEKILAQKMRSKGLSINQIKDKLGVAKSSVSLWVRDIKLTPSQKSFLSEKGQSKEIIEKRRLTRLARERADRQIIIDGAKNEIQSISYNELKLIGAALYWAEGGKTVRGLVRFSNGDPLMITVILRFFREVCLVPESKFRGHIHTHSHLDHKKSEKYWSKISGIPKKQFFKTYRKPSVASKNKKDNLPYCTFDVYVCSTELFLKIKGWTEKIFEVINQSQKMKYL